MVFASLAVGNVCINDHWAAGSKWPAVRVEVRSGRGVRGGLSVRCSLSIPARRHVPLSSSNHGSPRGSVWFGSSGLWSKGFKAALDYHQKASAATLQTLQRVGTLIRSTSLDCIAALGTKKAGSQQPSPDQPPPQGDDQHAIAGQLKASLSRFITTASQAEVSYAAMMSDLSNMAYDVEAITVQQLQEQHNLMLVAHSKGVSSSTAAPLPAAARVEAAAPAVLQASSELQQAQLSPLHRAASPAGTAAAMGMPQSPVTAGAAPGGYFSSYSAAGSSSSSGSQLGSAPTSPRTPFVLSSLAEVDDIFASADVQLATAAAPVNNQGTPQRRSLSGGASRSSSLAAAPAGTDALTLPTLQSSSSTGAALAAQLMQYQQQELEHTLAALQQYQLPAELAEQQAMLELQQQEQQVLLDMQQTQQLQLLLQQEQAIMHHLQEQASLGGDVSSSSSTKEAAATASATNAWLWLQQLQQQAAAAAAAATGAAAAGGRSVSRGSTSSAVDDPPADWFVCDGPATSESGAVRYFVIQGSISLDHWRINLTIDPCEYEGGALDGVKVHRGVYEAALQMYDSFVPFVREHLAKHPDGKVAFTGHSLGGSLATLLMLLLVHRGVLPATNVATVRTFGSPAIFCEGATGSPPAAGACNSCSLPCQHRKERAATSAAAGAAAAAAHGAAAPSRSPAEAGSTVYGPHAAATGAAGSDGGLLGRLGLAPETVVNVIMMRDIVPRAFVCDYTLVADVLKSWLPSFKEHAGLAACKQHKALYNFIGTVEVLQPSTDCPFMLPDETHAMLPKEAALYKLTEPCCNLPEPAAAAPESASSAASPCGVCSSCSSCGGCSNHGSNSQPDKERKGKLGSFGSWGSLASLNSLNLTSAIADLTSTFTLVSSSSIVSVPVSAEDAAASGAETTVELEVPASPAVPTAQVDTAAAQPAAPDATAALDPLNLTLGDAILTFMNSPHPLETLGEMSAYGPAGSISRFHNPTSYTTALQLLGGETQGQ